MEEKNSPKSNTEKKKTSLPKIIRNVFPSLGPINVNVKKRTISAYPTVHYGEKEEGSRPTTMKKNYSLNNNIDE